MTRILVPFLLGMGYLILVNTAFSATSETREVLPLDGIWNCYCESEGDPLEYLQQGGLRKLNGIVKMPVPGNFMDFVAQMDPKACPRVVWYERSFFVPKMWRNDRKIWLRLNGISAPTELWVNGENIATENKSYVPVEHEVTDCLLFDSANRIALAVDSRSIHRENIQFPGIPQSVSLRTVPEMLFIDSVSVNTTLANGTATISYKVIADGLLQLNRKCISVQVLDMDCTPVGSHTACGSLEGTIAIENCHLWWPLCMDPKAGYLYTLVFKLYYKYCDSVVRDVYRRRIGIRTLSWSNNSLMVNGKQFYLQDLHDVAMVKWLNGNAIITKLAPSEEMLNLADELGLLFILGSPSSALRDVVIRYRNHPSVISWSLSVVEDCNTTVWRQYYDQKFGHLSSSLINQGRFLDRTRPFTAVIPLTRDILPTMKKFDIITVTLPSKHSFNLALEGIEKCKKPIIIMYGDKFLSKSHRIRTLNYDPYPDVSDCENPRGDVSIVGEFFGNLVAYENFANERLTLADGIFSRNREPTAFADIIRSKFKERKSACPHRTPRCKYNKKIRKRV